MPIVKLLVQMDSEKPPGLVAARLQETLESKGAKDVSVTLCGTELVTMPFGKHRGKPMEDVPSKYLDWIIGEDWIEKWPDVKEYIMTNIDRIHKDLEDG